MGGQQYEFMMQALVTLVREFRQKMFKKRI